jgi:hypothetical protein
MQRISCIVLLFSLICSSIDKTTFEDEGSSWISTGSCAKLNAELMQKDGEKIIS